MVPNKDIEDEINFKILIKNDIITISPTINSLIEGTIELSTVAFTIKNKKDFTFKVTIFNDKYHTNSTYWLLIIIHLVNAKLATIAEYIFKSHTIVYILKLTPLGIINGIQHG